MHDFQTALNYINGKLYEPSALSVKAVREEKQNAKYGAGVFELSSKSVRFRVAKITPTKEGQFVAFWEKDENNKSQPYTFEEVPDLLVITIFINDNEFGQFVFPKEILLQQKILKADSSKGKMAMRVYPSWDCPSNKQAINTQKWQLPYFVDLCDTNRLPLEKILELYTS